MQAATGGQNQFLQDAVGDRRRLVQFTVVLDARSDSFRRAIPQHESHSVLGAADQLDRASIGKNLAARRDRARDRIRGMFLLVHVSRSTGIPRAKKKTSDE